MLSGRIAMEALYMLYPFWILYQLQQLFCISVMAEEYGFHKPFYFSQHWAVRDHCLLSSNGFSKAKCDKQFLINQTSKSLIIKLNDPSPMFYPLCKLSANILESVCNY